MNSNRSYSGNVEREYDLPTPNNKDSEDRSRAMEESKSYLEQAQAQIQQGSYHTAINPLETCLKIRTEIYQNQRFPLAQIHSLLSECHYNSKDYMKSTEHLEQYVSILKDYNMQRLQPIIYAYATKNLAESYILLSEHLSPEEDRKASIDYQWIQAFDNLKSEDRIKKHDSYLRKALPLMLNALDASVNHFSSAEYKKRERQPEKMGFNERDTALYQACVLGIADLYMLLEQEKDAVEYFETAVDFLRHKIKAVETKSNNSTNIKLEIEDTLNSVYMGLATAYEVTGQSHKAEKTKSLIVKNYSKEYDRKGKGKNNNSKKRQDGEDGFTEGVGIGGGEFGKMKIDEGVTGLGASEK